MLSSPASSGDEITSFDIKPDHSGIIVRSREIHVQEGDVLHFPAGTEPVHAEVLVRTIVNAAASTGRVREYIRGIIRPRAKRQDDDDTTVELPRMISHMAASRYIASLDDSLVALGKLLGGAEYIPRTPDWLDPEGKQDDEDTRLAQIYSRLKQLRDGQVDSVPYANLDYHARQEINNIMNDISSRSHHG